MIKKGVNKDWIKFKIGYRTLLKTISVLENRVSINHYLFIQLEIQGVPLEFEFRYLFISLMKLKFFLTKGVTNHFCVKFKIAARNEKSGYHPYPNVAELNAAYFQI